MLNNKVNLELTINESEKEFLCCNSFKLRIMLYKKHGGFCTIPRPKSCAKFISLQLWSGERILTRGTWVIRPGWGGVGSYQEKVTTSVIPVSISNTSGKVYFLKINLHFPNTKASCSQIVNKI
jgi:hypothetical protein